MAFFKFLCGSLVQLPFSLPGSVTDGACVIGNLDFGPIADTKALFDTALAQIRNEGRKKLGKKF